MEKKLREYDTSKFRTRAYDKAISEVQERKHLIREKYRQGKEK